MSLLLLFAPPRCSARRSPLALPRTTGPSPHAPYLRTAPTVSQPIPSHTHRPQMFGPEAPPLYSMATPLSSAPCPSYPPFSPPYPSYPPFPAPSPSTDVRPRGSPPGVGHGPRVHPRPGRAVLPGARGETAEQGAGACVLARCVSAPDVRVAGGGAVLPGARGETAEQGEGACVLARCVLAPSVRVAGGRGVLPGARGRSAEQGPQLVPLRVGYNVHTLLLHYGARKRPLSRVRGCVLRVNRLARRFGWGMHPQASSRTCTHTLALPPHRIG